MRRINCFVSYSWQSRYTSAVPTLVRRLLRHPEIEIWIDRKNIAVGQKLYARLQQAIDIDCDVFVPVICKSYLSSEMCQMELKRSVANARSRKATILPVLLEDCHLPIYLEDIVWADFKAVWSESRLINRRALDAAILRLVNGIRLYENEHVHRARGLCDWRIRSMSDFHGWVFIDRHAAYSFPLVCEIFALHGWEDPGRVFAEVLEDWRSSGFLTFSEESVARVKYREHEAFNLPQEIYWTSLGQELWDDTNGRV